MDHMQMFLLAGALAVTLATTYIFWGPSHRPRRNAKVPGLQNVGNSCFLNAILQALSSCPAFIIWLKTIVQQKIEKEEDVSKSVCSVVLSLMKDLNIGYGTYSPIEVIRALQRKNWVISNDEQDAHEFFHVLTATLEEETVDNHPILSLLEVAKLQAPRCLKSDFTNKPFLCSTSAISPKHTLPMKGMLANLLICKQCGYKYPVRYDTFDSISLSIPSPHWGPLKLQDCLKSFVSCELVTDVSCDICCKARSDNEPKGKTTFSKQLSFGKLPDCLCFHIQRKLWTSNGIPIKCFDHIMFPEILSMDSFVYKAPLSKSQKENVSFIQKNLTGGSIEVKERAQTLPEEVKKPLQTEISANFNTTDFLSDKSLNCNDHLYILKAVIVHLGDILSGHFVTYRRSASGKKWFYASDSSTKEVTFAEVARVCAYMLFYEKLQIKAEPPVA